ncbi:hypothetical protein [Psychrobacter namhaensis]|uniref:hypothetical protein n=1 Tax=Psychrobacter namhaensis TaxID=292734 RepID=UPI0018DFD989|nr:hypothetical protein [Psychrobacter namhaensis]
MPHILWSLVWRLIVAFGYPLVMAIRSSQAQSAYAMSTEPMVSNSLEQLARTNSFGLILGACFAFWFCGSVLGTVYRAPDDLRDIEIRPWIRFLICLMGGLAAFLWVLNSEGQLNLLMPLWVGGVAFVSPHLIQIVPSIVKNKLGIGGKS